MRALLVTALLLLALVGSAEAQATGYETLDNMIANGVQEYINDSDDWAEYSLRAYDIQLAGIACAMFVRESATATWVNVGEFSIPQQAANAGGVIVPVFYMRSPGCALKGTVGPRNRIIFDVHSSYGWNPDGSFNVTYRPDQGAGNYGTAGWNGIQVSSWTRRVVAAP